MGNLINTSNNYNTRGFNPRVDNSIKKANVSIFAKLIWYFSFILIIPILIHISIRNNFFNLQTKINSLSSGIDVQLKKRRDTLIKLLDSTKGFMKHEKSLFIETTKLRKMEITPEKRTEVSDRTDSVFSKLIAVHENYPELKSNEHVNNLMEQITYLEREISAIRRLYNSDVQKINSKLFMFPSSVVATEMQLYTFPYFEAKAEDKKDVEINF